MAAVLTIDLRHLLDERGAIGPAQGPGRQLADFIVSIVAAATAASVLPEGRPATVPCRHQRGRAAFPGQIAANIAAGDEIVWRCDHCGEGGFITHWQCSFWDLSHGNSAETANHPPLRAKTALS
jgi:hypothetical protein